MVANPEPTGVFDGTQSPIVRIQDLNANTLIAEFSTTSGSGSETVRVVPEDEHYIVNWHTDEFGLDESHTYRVTAQVDGTVLGYADVDVVGNGRELKNVETGEFIPLLDGRTLPIKFRIEEGAVSTESLAYVATFDGLMVVNTTTQSLVTTIPVGTQANGVAITPDGGLVYVADPGSKDLSVISTATNSVIATIPLVDQPVEVTVAPDGQLAYVATQNSFTLTVIDVATNTVQSTTAVPSGGAELKVRPDGLVGYLMSFSGLLVFDPATGSVTTTVGGIAGSTLDITPDGSRVYAANQLTNTVSVVSTTDNTVLATIPVGNQPRGVGVTPDGSFVYVGNRFSDNVSVISTATNTVVATVPVGSLPRDLAVTADGQFVYVTLEGSTNLSVIATATNAVVATVPLGAAGAGITVTP